MTSQAFEKIQIATTGSYQMIKDKHLTFIVLSHQQLAGSRVLRSTYRHVVFSECVFYATEFQGVRFENCIFENCNFSFLHLRNCQFINCSFHNCSWQACSSTLSIYRDCSLDEQLNYMTMGNHNEVAYSQKDDHTTDIYIENLLAA